MPACTTRNDDGVQIVRPLTVNLVVLPSTIVAGFGERQIKVTELP